MSSLFSPTICMGTPSFFTSTASTMAASLKHPGITGSRSESDAGLSAQDDYCVHSGFIDNRGQHRGLRASPWMCLMKIF